jgi:UDP-glucuronate decarboxylase
VFEPLPTDDPTRRCPDITLARRVLGWEPEVGLEVGLRRTIDHFAALLAVGGRARTEGGGVRRG